MMKKVEIIVLESETQYRDFYNKIFVGDDFSIGGIPISFNEKDFDHIFFEPCKGGNYKFSVRRAKRMLFIKEILAGKFDRELMFEEDRGNFAIFCYDLECVVYLRSRVGSGKLQIGTFFDFGKNHEKMYLKQKKKCISITLQELKDKL
jgi:hypothetical protein